MISSGELTDENYDAASAELLELIGHAARRGVSAVQLREKALCARLLTELARSARRILLGSSTKLFINDRADIALIAGADGVHLTSHSMKIGEARSLLGEDIAIAIACHTIEDVMAASAAGADAIVFGPVFESPGKSSFVGTDGLRLAVKAADATPLIALGGVDAINFSSVIKMGAAGFAAIRAFKDAASIDRLMERM